MRKIIYFIIISSIGLLSWYSIPFFLEKKEEVQEQTAVVTRGDIQLAISSTGRVVSNLDIAIKCKASGEIEAILYDVSDTVKKGDLLLQLDPQDEERNVKEAQVSLKAAEAKFKQAKQNLAIAQEDFSMSSKQAKSTEKSAQSKLLEAKSKYQRKQQLLQQGLSSEEESETAKETYLQSIIDLENANLQIEQLKMKKMELALKEEDITLAATEVELKKIALLNAQQRLKETKVFAPIDAVVAERNVQVGQIISSGINNVNEGTSVLTLSDLNRVFVVASVDESDIGKISVGQEVVITTDAYKNRKFPGNVVRIATKGINTSNVVTFEVKIEVFGEDKRFLKPEMTANVDIISASRKNILLIPVEALQSRKDKNFVVIPNNDEEIQKVVQTGISDDIYIEITEGLQEKDVVLIKKRENASKWKRNSIMPMRRGL